jgi:hypothetical protein
MATATKPKTKSSPVPKTGSYTDIEALVRSLSVDAEEIQPDAHILAQQIAYEGKKKNRAVPVKQADLAAAITTIALDLTRSGAPSLTLTLQDPRWNILDSDFFVADDTGKLLDIDVNYPMNDDGTPGRFWWRLHQFSPSGSSYQIQLTFLPRGVGKLMGLFGPKQADRASRTRAEFLKMLCSAVPEIEFYSNELDQKQPIGSVSDNTHSTTKKSSNKVKGKGKAAKVHGLGAGAQNLTIKGAKITTNQAVYVNKIMQQGSKMQAPQAAIEACMFSGICESQMGVAMNWNPTYGGLLGGSVNNFGHLGAPTSDAVTMAEITAYYQGGLGYSTGAIKLSQQYQNIGQLAAHTAGCVLPGNSYGPNGYGQYGQQDAAGQMAEAKALVANGGGGGGGVGTASSTEQVAQPYYFAVNQNEDYWSAMCRLAQEVGWELIADGDRIYFDSDNILIYQKIAAVIDRNDPTTLNWSYDWENRHLATNFRIDIVADPFEFAAGEVIQVRNFGVAAQGSTAKPPRPGVWMIDEITHTKGDLFSSFSLVQPLPPKPEPAPQYTTVDVQGGTVAQGLAGAGGAQNGFCNPFPDGWTPSRLDMGYDGTFKNRIVAPFDGLVTCATSSFSNWGGFVVIQSASDIGLPTKTLYFAEGIKPAVAQNTWVKKGQTIATATPSPWNGISGNIEFGVAMEAHGLGPLDVYGKQLGNGSAASRKMVLAFSDWCQKTLGIAPPSATDHAGSF